MLGLAPNLVFRDAVVATVPETSGSLLIRSICFHKFNKTIQKFPVFIPNV